MTKNKNSKTINVDLIADWAEARQEKSSYTVLVEKLLTALGYTGYWGDVASLTVKADGSYKVKAHHKNKDKK